MPPLPGTFLDGAAMVSASGVPVVGLTLRHDRIDNFWFTLLHEPDDLARDALIPANILDQVVWSSASSYDDIITVSTRARVPVAVVAGRWQRDHQNYKKFSRLID